MRIFFKALVLFTVLTKASSAQQIATYAQYMFNGLAINPAYAGSDDALNMTMLGRFQNVGLSGAPNTQTFSAHTPLLNQRVGLGALIIHDKLSVIGQTGVHFSYAYRIPLSQTPFSRYDKNKATISFGIQAGVSIYNAEYTKLEIFNPDPAFSQDIRNTRPNIGAGIYYSNTVTYIGVSMPSMINNVFDRGENYTTVYQNVPVILTAGHVFTLNHIFKLKPSFLFKMIDGQPVEFDLNANVLYDEVLWLGMSYKSSKQVALLMQFKVNDQFQFGYSYTITAGPIRTVELGSHEIMLNYRFWFNKKGVISPRYF